MAGASHETEIKLPAESVEAAKRMLFAAGFRVWKRRRFEDNSMLDTPGMKLRAGAEALRIRQAGGKTTLTYKGRPVAGKHKSREELEVEVSDAGTLRAIASRLGFEPVFRYQKYRTEYKRRGGAGVATLDETPIGVYVELEGQPGWIDRMAKRLGCTERDYITSSYARLYLEWREWHKGAARDMVFPKRASR
jgi:adenylate cyclase class 2